MPSANVYYENVFLITLCTASHQKEQEHGLSAGINLIFQSLLRIIFTNIQTTLIITGLRSTLPPSPSVSAHVLTQFIKDSWMSDWRSESHFKCWWSWMKPPHFFYNWNANYYHWQTLHCIVDTYVRLKTCIVYTDNTYLKCYKLNSNYFCFKDVSSEAGGSVSPVNKRRVFSGEVQSLRYYYK